jgi:hypothetical protein
LKFFVGFGVENERVVVYNCLRDSESAWVLVEDEKFMEDGGYISLGAHLAIGPGIYNSNVLKGI